MKRSNIHLLIFLLICLLSSCHRQLLEEWYISKARIPISIDWSKSNIDPQNVSMLFFNKSDGTLALTHYFENNNKPIQSYVDVPAGEYTVLVFNELPNQIKNVSININDTYDNIEAIGSKASNISLPIEGNTYYGQPGELASTIVNDFEVTSSMIYYLELNHDSIGKWPPNQQSITALMNLVPLRNLSQFKGNIHFDGLKYARSPVLITLQNVSGSYYFEQNDYGITPVSYQVSASNREYDENSTVNGTISTQFSLYGVIKGKATTEYQPTDTPIMLTINIQLIDKERTIVTRQYDITKLITFSEQSDGTILIELNLKDPVSLPEVKSENDGESGFETSVEEWEVIDIPIDT